MTAATPQPESNLRPAWRFHDSGGDWTILREWDVAKDEDEDVVRNPPMLSSLLQRWMADSFSQTVLLDLCRQLWGPTGFRAGHPALRDDLLARLQDEFSSGRLVLLKHEFDESKASASTPAAGPPAARPPAARPSRAR